MLTPEQKQILEQIKVVLESFENSGNEIFIDDLDYFVGLLHKVTHEPEDYTKYTETSLHGRR